MRVEYRPNERGELERRTYDGLNWTPWSVWHETYERLHVNVPLRMRGFALYTINSNTSRTTLLTVDLTKNWHLTYVKNQLIC